MAFEDSLIGNGDDFDPNTALDSLIRQQSAEPLPGGSPDPRMLNTRLARKLGEPTPVEPPPQVTLPESDSIAAPDFSAQAIEPATAISTEADFSAQAAEPPMIGPEAPPVTNSTGGLSDYPVEFGKGVLEGGKNMGAAALKGVAAVGIPTVAAPDLLDELGRSKDMTPGQRAKLMGRVLRDISDRGLQMDYNAALRRVSQGGDAAKEIDALRPKFEANNKAATEPVTEKPLYKAGQAVEDFGKEALAPRPGFEPGKSWTRDIGSGAGSMAAGIAASMVPGIGPTLAGTIFTASGMGEATDNAVKGGATNDQIRLAAKLGGVAGATDLVDALLPMLGGTGRALGFIKRMGVAAVKGALMEGGQEGIQQLMQNAIAKGIYKPDQDLFEDVPRSMAIAAILGGAGGGISGAAHSGDRAAPGLPPPPGGGAAPGTGPSGGPAGGPTSSPEDIADFVRRARESAPPPEPPGAGPSASSAPDPASMSEAERMHAYSASRDSHGGASETEILKAAGLDPATMSEQERIDAVIRAAKQPDATGNADGMPGAEQPHATGPEPETSHLRYATLREYGYSDSDIDAMSPAQRKREFNDAITDGIKPGEAMTKHKKREPKAAEAAPEQPASSPEAPATESDVGGEDEIRSGRGVDWGTRLNLKEKTDQQLRDFIDGVKQQSDRFEATINDPIDSKRHPKDTIDHYREQVAVAKEGIAAAEKELATRKPTADSAPQRTADDTGQNVPESRATLKAQQNQLIAGERAAQMFPKGTREMPLPPGMERVETERGVFHFDPKKTTAKKITEASAAGRENDVLGLGSFSKEDIAARQGEKPVTVVERTTDGTEVRAAVGTEATAAQQLAEMEKGKSPGNTVSIETAEQTLEGRKPKGTRDEPIDIKTTADIERVAKTATIEHTHAQGEANNRQLGHGTWNGLPISIEVAPGGTRKMVNPSTGEPVEVTHSNLAAYGYFPGTVGADGMHVDLYLGSAPDSPTVYVFDEIDNKTGKFRQHKVMGGFRTEQNAFSAYVGTSSKSAATLGASTAMSVPELKTWLESGDTTKALKPVPETAKATPAKRSATVSDEPLTLLQFLASKGGLAPDPELTALDIGDHRVQIPGRKGFFGLIRPTGMKLDMAREAAEEAGYLRGEHNKTSTIRDLLDLIGDGLRGQHKLAEGDEAKTTKKQRTSLAESSAAARDAAIATNVEAIQAEYTELPEGIAESAAAIMADELVGLDDAVELAAVRAVNEDTDYEITTDDITATYGEGATDAIQTRPASGDGGPATSAGDQEQQPGESQEAVADGEPDARAGAEGGEGKAVDETIEKVAVRDPSTGKVWAAKAVMHPDLIEVAAKELGVDPDDLLPQLDYGYETNTGRFVGRQEAARIGSGDPESMDELHAGELSWTREEIAAQKAQEAKNEPSTERTEAGEQTVLPGAEKIGQGEQVQRRADQPLKPKVPQRSMDDGLFGSSMDQVEMALGADADLVAPVDIARAAEIMADNPGMPPETAFGQAVAVGAVEQGFITEQEAEESYGPEVQEALEAERERASRSSEGALGESPENAEAGGGAAAQTGVVPGGGEAGGQAAGNDDGTAAVAADAAEQPAASGDQAVGDQTGDAAQDQPAAETADRTTIIEGATPGEFLVRSDGHNLARFELVTRGRTTSIRKVKYFFGNRESRDSADEAIRSFTSGQKKLTIQAGEPDGVPLSIHAGDAPASPEDVQPDEPGRDADGVRGREGSGGEQTVPRSDGERTEGTGRVSEGAGSERGDRASDGGDARLSEPRADDTADGRAQRAQQRAADNVEGENFTIEPGALDEGRGQKAKARDNINAIHTLKTIEAEGRPATHAEQVTLSKYVGWGGIKNIFPDAQGNLHPDFLSLGEQLQSMLTPEEYETARRSIQYAHYTAEDVVRSMWAAVTKMGFAEGQVFEPGMGVGNFAGMMPADVAANTHYSGLELDHVTAGIAKLLYPKWGVRQDDFTKAPLPENNYDLVIGNPPFADVAIKSDPKYKQGFLLHDYFFAKSLDAVRPGGLLAFVTSAGTMNKIDPAAREYLADRADLVGAIRLPGDAFLKNAGTAVTTDIIFLRKRLPGDIAGDRTWTETVQTTLPNSDGMKITGNVSRYFAEHPEMILGEPGFFDKLYKNRYAVRARPGSDIKADLAKVIDSLPAGIMSPWQNVNSGHAEQDFTATEKKEGTYYVGPDGSLHQVTSGIGQKVGQRGKGVENGRTAADMERIKALIPVRDALRAVYAADLQGDTANAERARAQLNKDYDAFVKAFGPINKSVIQTRRPNVIQMESARAEAREEARYADAVFKEGSFDATPLLDAKTPLSVIARKRQEAREDFEKRYLNFDEGDFDPEDVPDVIIDKRPNVDPFMDDPESYRLRAIERYDEGTGTGHKSDVFFKNVISREVVPKISSVNDALLYSLSQYGRVNIPAMAELAKKSESEVIEALGDQVFKVPGTKDAYQTRDEYLSGNVRKKLALAESAAAKNPDFRRNVAALEAAQPIPLAPSQIHATLGMSWIPADVVKDFGLKELGLEKLNIRYVKQLASWQVSGDTDSVAASTTWGTTDRRAPALLQDALNRQTVKIYDKFRGEDGREQSIINVAKTEAAQDKVRAMQERFAGWIWEDQARSDRLAGFYNENFNNLVVREYNGDYLTTPGIATSWSWRPHQKRVIARIIQSGNTYVAHAVGAGKTSEYIGAIMEMRRLGLVRKPMVAVPNHMLAQFTKEWYEQYPTARLAVADDKRFHTDRRKQFIANVAMEDLDAIIVTHSSFGMIPVSADFSNSIIQREISQYRELLASLQGGDNRITRSRVEKQIERLEQRLMSKGGRKDSVFTFEQMGVDHLTVDEAHLFRKLDFSTNMSNLKGVSPEGSAMAWDLYVKSLYLDSIRPGRGLVLGSGTPITNTMAELYTLSRYMQPQVLAERGLEKFDAWAGAFGESVSELEQDAAGNYKPVSRFAKFVNVAELSAMARQVMDVVTSKQLEQYVTRPQIAGGKRQLHLAEKSRALVRFQENLAARMKAIQERKGPPKKGDDIMLSVINDGRHAAIDMRLAGGTASNEPSKLEMMVDNIHRIWQETKKQQFYKTKPGGGYEDKPAMSGPATQLVFVNLGLSGARGFSVPDYIRAELTRRGIPKNEVAYIYDYKSATQKQRLFNDMNEGKVRILIGSVAKMGVGTNVQRRLVAIHNMDPLWYPADDEQRNGRGIRQGNMNREIAIHDYATKGTYDSTMWGMMAKKGKFIEGFFEGDPSLRDMDDLGESSQYEQAKAMTTNDPRLIRFTELKQELEKANRRKTSFDSDVYHTRQRRARAESEIEHYTQRVEDTKKDIAQRVDTRADAFKATIGKESFDKRVDFGEALFARLEKLEASGTLGGAIKVAEIGGFPIYAEVRRSQLLKNEVSTDVSLGLNGKQSRDVSYDVSPLGTVRSIESILGGFEGDLAEYQARLAKASKFYAESEAKAKAKFSGDAEIADLTKQVNEMAAALATPIETSERTAPAEDYSLPEDFALAEPGQPDPNGLPIDAEGLRQWRVYSPSGFAVGLGNTKNEAFAHFRKWEADNRGESLASLSDMTATLTPLAAEKQAEVARMLTAIVRAVAGDIPSIEFHEGLIPVAAPPGYPAGMSNKAAGQYRLGQAIIRLALTSNADQMATTAFHESFHHVEDRLLSTAELKLMREETSRLREWIKGKTRLSAEQVDGLAGYEVRAIAFETYASERVAGSKNPGSGIHIGVRRWFERLMEMLRRIKNGLKGLGFNTAEDVFNDVFTGEVAGRPDRGQGGIHELHDISSLADIYGPVADRIASKFGDRFTELRVLLQDRFIRVRHVQDSFGGVPTAQDAYMAESLLPGRTGQRLEELERERFEPLIEEMQARGVALEEMSDYLYAKHAPERNAAMDAINHPNLAGTGGRDLRGRGSGMSNDEAAEIMDRIRAAGRMDDFEAVERMVRDIQQGTVDTLVDYGLISEETAAAWAAQYEFYAPLQGFDEAFEDESLFGLRGAGLDTRARESKRAFGRLSKAAGPLPYIMMQAELAIVRGEKNKVGNTFLRLVRSHPNPSLWSVNSPKLKKTIDNRTGLVTMVADTNWHNDPNVFVTKVGGQINVIRMEGKDGQNLARALKNMGTENLNEFLRFMRVLTFTMARLSTQWNPNFVVPNLVRDLGEAYINLQEQDRQHFVKQFTKHLIPAIGGSFQGIRGVTGGRYAAAFREYDAAGGRVRFFGLDNATDVEKNIRRQMRRLQGGPVATIQEAGSALAEGFDAVNGAMENATRLAAYMAARDVGLSIPISANLALNLTVNFTKKGELGPAMNSLYMFANATMQGGRRTMSALKNKHVRRATYMLIGLGALSAMLAYGAGGDDDSGENYYAKIPKWERDKNLIIMWPKGYGKDGGYIKIPLPFLFGAFKVLGDRLAGVMMGKDKVGESIGAVFKAVLDGLNPLGEESASMFSLLPSVTRPAAHIQANVNWNGRPIYPTRDFEKNKPDSEQSFNSTPAYAKAAARGLNRATGGSPYKSGGADVHPGSIQHVLESLTGGLGKFLSDASSTADRAWKGQPFDATKAPIIRRFVGSSNTEQADASRYYDQREEARKNGGDAIKNARKDRAAGVNREDADSFLKDNTNSVRGEKIFKEADAAMKPLRDRKSRIEASDSNTAEQMAEVENIKQRMRDIQNRARKQYRELKQQQQGAQ